MDKISINLENCTLCGACIESCPFDSIKKEADRIEIADSCTLCGNCIESCPTGAIKIDSASEEIDKSEWKDILIFGEQEGGDIHPVVYELLGEAEKLAEIMDHKVKCVLIGDPSSKKSAEKLLPYGADEVFVYASEEFAGFRADVYSDAFADCISKMKPSVVLIGGTPVGRALAPRLAVRFGTGLTADCTTLSMKDNSDLVQIRPAFGGDIMAEILIENARPQFATVRYRVMDRAKRRQEFGGVITEMSFAADESAKASKMKVVSVEPIAKNPAIEEAEIIVAVGRGVRNEEGLDLCRRLADSLGGSLAYTRPMVEKGIGDQLYQIGLSGHTVRPRLMITVGVSGAIQFTTCMQGADTIVAINSDPEARIFTLADYCIVDDLYKVLPELINLAENREVE